MVNEKMQALGDEPSAIRELFAYGLARKAKIGEDAVFDYSLGNPSVPPPEKLTNTLKGLLEMSPVELHSYSPSAGVPSVREAIAKNISNRFGISASASHVYMTAGASASVSISVGAIASPGSEIIVPTPYFPEYKVWVENAGCKIVEVPVEMPSFQLDVKAIANAVTRKTAAVIINSPNNPVGTVYTCANLEALAVALRAKEQEVGHAIYIISDEPYRELTYGAKVPYVPCIYARTLVCYSYSKALSLPGERIGYIYVSDLMEGAEADKIFAAVCGAGRALGYTCAPVLFQRAVAECANEPANVAAYAKNREILTSALDRLGYEYVAPDGAFYLWVRALEADANAFSERAKGFELLIVPSNSFGCEGWVRLCYSIPTKTIEASIGAFEKLKASYS